MAYEEYSIGLGVELDESSLSSVEKRINNLTNNSKLINLEFNKDKFNEQLKGIRKQLKTLSDTKINIEANAGDVGSINLNPTDVNRINEAFSTLYGLVSDVRKSIGTLDDGSEMKSLLASINNISDALSDVVKQFKTLSDTMSRNSFNVDIKFGNSKNNPINNNTAYGNFVRKNALPQLKQQMQEYANEIEKYVPKGNNAENTIAKLISIASRSGKISVNSFDPILNAFEDLGSMQYNTQLDAYSFIFAETEKAADALGIKLNDVKKKFGISADEIIQKAYDIKNGVANATEDTTDLKSIFGTDLTTVNKYIEEIAVNLNEVKKAIQDLSSNSPIDNITQSFEKLQKTLEYIEKSITD